MRLAGINVDYEEQLEHWFKQVETPGAALDWRVEKMRFSKTKRRIRYNDFLTLDGIPRQLSITPWATVRRWNG